MTRIVQQLALFLLGLVAGTVPVHAQVTPLDLHQSRALRSMAHVQAGAVYRPLETTHLYQQDLNWINETRTRNEFVDGQLWQQHQDTWDGEVFGEWKETGVTGYDYSGGKLSMETTFEVSETGLTPLARTSYAYSGYGGYPGYTEITTQVYREGTWVNEERTTLNVSDVSNDQITGGLTELWNGTEWEPSEQFTLVEEVNQHFTSVIETYQSWSGTEWINAERSIYPVQTIAGLYVWMERFMAELADYEGMYYSLRGLPSFTAQEWDGSVWVDVSRLRNDYAYHVPDGYLMQQVSTTEEWTDGAWAPTSRMVIDYATSSAPYGASGMPAKTSLQVYDGETWADLFVEKYISQVWQESIHRIAQATVEIDLGEGLQEMSRVRIDWTVIATSTDPTEAPGRFELGQNAPNPFTSGTDITFRLSEPQHVRLAVYDLLGREVAVLKEEYHSAGEHRVRWEAADKPSGIYLYRLAAGARSETRRMVLLK